MKIKNSAKNKIISMFNFIDKFHILTILFVLFAILFVFVRENIFGLMLGVIFVLMVIEDIIKGLLTEGFKSELKELVIGLVVALIIWYSISFLLNTSTPISAVVSCSMLPTLERGDMVLVHGGNTETYGTIYLDDISQVTPDALVVIGNREQNVEGSVHTHCSMYPKDAICLLYRSEPEKVTELHGPLEFGYGRCKRVELKTGETFIVPCVVSVKKSGTDDKILLYPHKEIGDIVVYQPNKGDMFSYVGDIVHRAVVTIKTKQGTYYLTKGDNNQVTDIQIYYPGYGGNRLVPEQNIKGNVVLRVPIIGYIKLLISAQLEMPEQCSYIFNE